MKKIIFIILGVLFLSGCTGREPNDKAYISAMGIDKGEKEGYSITIQFARPSNISGGSGEKAGDVANIVENIKIEAGDIFTAVNTANHMISKRLSLSHMKLIVFSEETASEGIKDIMQTLLISDEVRPNLITAVSRGSANEYLENTKPIIEMNPIKYYHLIYERNNSAGIPSAAAIDVMSDLISGYSDIIMPLAGVSDGKSSDNEKNKEGFESGSPDYKAGDIDIINDNKSEALGMAVFKGDKFIAELGKTEADIYNILVGNYANNYTSISYPEGSGKRISVRLNESRRPAYKIDIKNKYIKIKICMEGEYGFVPDGELPDDNDFSGAAEREISEKCRSFILTMRDKYNVDAVGLGGKVKKYFPDMEKYEDYDFRSKFAEYNIDVETEINIKHSGVINR